MVLGLPWLRSYNTTVNWKERYADIQHGSSSCRLSFDESRHSTQLKFQAASKLDLLSTLSSSTSRASPVGSPAPHAKERPDLHSSTRVQNGARMFDESETEDGISDEECSDMFARRGFCANVYSKNSFQKMTRFNWDFAAQFLSASYELNYGYTDAHRPENSRRIRHKPNPG